MKMKLPGIGIARISPLEIEVPPKALTFIKSVRVVKYLEAIEPKLSSG
jgi:hypothetical protein